MAGRGRHGISYVQNEEPAFLKAFKARAGYKEGPTVDSKRENLQYEEDDRSDTEEEKPTVVVLRDGDLTAEQVHRMQKGNHDDAEPAASPGEDDDENLPSDGKITFKKPTKRQNEETSELKTSTKKVKSEKSKKKSDAKKVKNSSLLSFDDEEEEEIT